MIAVICAVVLTPLTVTYSGLKPGKAYQPFGTDSFGIVLSTDPSELGPAGSFIARGTSHESHFNDPGVPVVFSLDAIHETNRGSYKFTPLEVSCG